MVTGYFRGCKHELLTSLAMKLLLFISIFSMVSDTVFSQYSDSTVARLATDHLQKSNKQRTAGWILLGGGAGLAGIGLIVGASTFWSFVLEGGNNGMNTAEVLSITGLVSMASSIPLFLAAGKNRRKAAAALSFKIEQATIIRSWAASVSRYPVVAFGIHL